MTDLVQTGFLVQWKELGQKRQNATREDRLLRLG